MKKGLSIKVTAALIASIFMIITTAAVAFVGYRLYYRSKLQSYIAYTDTVLNFAYTEVEKYSLGDMIAAREMPETYEQLRKELNQVRDCCDVQYLYAVYFEDVDDIHSLYYAINAKTKEELSQGIPYTYMGRSAEQDGFAEETLETLRDAVKTGKKDDGFLVGYSKEYGYQLNGYHVIFDRSKQPVGLLCVEIDINRINEELRQYIYTVVAIAAVLTGLLFLLYHLITQHYLIGPIQKIAGSSEDFVNKMQRHLEPSELTYRQVHVKSGYEVMQLSDNIRNLADSVKNYMIHLREATIERERLGAELALATEIQDSVLPSIYPAFPERPEVDIYATMNPAREVGGDFYDFFFVDDDHLCITMADVSGKGVPAALFMMASKISLQNYALMNKSPAEILTETNAALCVKNEKKMFVTVWLGILEISTGKMTAANAGHEYPVLRHGNGRFEIYKDKHGFVIGGMAGIKYKEYEIQLNPGDKFFIYTDGVPEAMNAEHKMFGLERMTDALNEEPDAGTVKIVENVKASVERFVKDEEQFDDLTMLCLEYKGKQEGSNPAEQTSAQSGG